MTQPYKKERREHQRYGTSEGTFVNASRSFGRVVDISLGGMKFHYLNWDEGTEAEGQLDLYLNGEDVMTDVPFRVLPDPPQEETETTHKVIVKQCRVQFKKLNKSQREKLEHFILHQTSGSA